MNSVGTRRIRLKMVKNEDSGRHFLENHDERLGWGQNYQNTQHYNANKAVYL